MFGIGVPMLPTLRIRMFGRCSLESDLSDIQDLNCARARELLGYLTCHRGRHLAREAVIGTLWGEMPEEQAKRALRQTLWQVNSTLEPFQITASKPFIEADGEWIRLNPHSAIWLDIARFEDLEKMTRRAKGQPHTETQIDQLNEAVSIYRGQLMEDCFKDWCIRQRRVFHGFYLQMLQRLMRSQRESGDFEGAMATAFTVLREEPASEKAHLTLMLLYYQEGDRTSALRQFEQYKRAVREELNAAPSRTVVDLSNSIREEMGVEIVNDPVSEASGGGRYEERVVRLLEEILALIIRNRHDIQ